MFDRAEEAEKMLPNKAEDGNLDLHGQLAALHHFSFVVSDLQRSLDFYSGLIGLELRSQTRYDMSKLRAVDTGDEWQGDGDPTSVPVVDLAILELSGVRVELVNYVNLAVSPPEANPRLRAGAAHMALRVKDIREVRRRLEAAGAKLVTPLLTFPETGHRPWTWCRCEDPDGIYVELVEEMPISFQLEAMADRLREMRLHRGLTLREVAASSDISAGHLSQVERGETVPSIPALLAVSSALGVAPDYFLRPAPHDVHPEPSEATARLSVRAPVDQTLPASQPCEEQYYEVALPGAKWEPLTGPNSMIKLARMRYEVGAVFEKMNGGPPGSGSCAVLEGTLLAEIGSTQNVLTAPSSISFDLSVPSRFSNIGDTPAICIYGLCQIPR